METSYYHFQQIVLFSFVGVIVVRLLIDLWRAT